MTSRRASVYMVIQPSISHYREPLIRKLLASPHVDFSLFGCLPASLGGDTRDWARPAAADALDRVKVVNTRAFGPLRWQPGVVRAVARGGYDAYVLEGNIYILSAWVCLLIGRIRRKPVFLWGHGWKRSEAGPKLKVRRLFYSLSSGLMLYGNTARDFAVTSGLNPDQLAVVYNSIYPQKVLAEASARAVDVQGVADRLGLDSESPTVIVSCRLTSRHRVDLLAEAIGLIDDASLRPNVVVVGDGSQREFLERRFTDRGLNATFVGAEYDPTRLAEYFGIADLAISPAASGLNVIQAMGFGVPVVAPDADPTAGPEVETVVHGSTGARFRLGDAESLSQTILETLSDRQRLTEMGADGMAVVDQRYSTERHARAIEQCLTNWLARDDPGKPTQR